MPMIPVRDLGKIGVFPDANPYDLPINAFSMGRNVLFDEGKIQRAPVFKSLYSAFKSNLPYEDFPTSYDSQVVTYENTLGPAQSTARFVTSYNTTQEVLVVCDRDGSVREYPNGSLLVVTPGTTLVTNEEPWTHTQTAGISVLARKGSIPYVRNLQTDPLYYAMAGDWVSTHSCAIMRGFQDYLVALNVTKGAVENPTMVKWSNPLPYSPSISGINWDPSNTTYLAGENILADMRTPILDGLALHNTFIIYSSDQVWGMELSGSSSVFNFRRIFPSSGIINTNCVVEVEGKHMVFGTNDIYVHDGVGKKTIADERIRRTIYQSLDRNKINRCFVHHDSILNLVYFCYNSKESGIGFTNTPYCNVAAVYNYRNDTWSFMDLPNVVGGAEANIDLSSGSYEEFDQPYGTFNSIYSGFDNETPRVTVMLGATDTANGLMDSRVYAVDLPTIGLVPLAVSPETLREPFVERLGIDMDKELGAELRTYKMVKCVEPQLDIVSPLEFATFQFGGQDVASQAINWQEPVVFDHVNDYKVDTRASGRYLAMRVTFPKEEFFRWSGFDIQLAKTGSR